MSKCKCNCHEAEDISIGYRSSFKFGKASMANLLLCSKQIQKVLKAALATSSRDFSVICGHRSIEIQRALYAQGRTKAGDIVTWTKHSKHNEFPSEAADVVPFPLNWDDIEAFNEIGQHILNTAVKMGVYDWNWGGKWEKHKDRPHHELSEYEY